MKESSKEKNRFNFRLQIANFSLANNATIFNKTSLLQLHHHNAPQVFEVFEQQVAAAFLLSRQPK